MQALEGKWVQGVQGLGVVEAIRGFSRGGKGEDLVRGYTMGKQLDDKDMSMPRVTIAPTTTRTRIYGFKGVRDLGVV